MRWKGREQSRNVEDRRRGGGAKVVGGGLSVGAILFFLAYTLLTGEPPTDMMKQMPGQTEVTTTRQTDENDELAEFTKVILKDTEDVWHKLFREQLNARYREPVLVLYSGSTMAGCGFASAAMGPFYCPADEKIYIDLDFFRDLKRKFGVSGDFAIAYIVAHEVGHHVQKLLGITDAVQRKRRYLSQKEYNQLSVRMELQADYLAGVWAHHIEKMKHVLDENDIEEAVKAAAAVGDDYLQKKYTGRVVPDAFTHGTSEQRVRWFLKGFKSGRIADGDTFSAREL